MSLVLAVDEGDSVYVNDTRIQLESIISPSDFFVLVHANMINRVRIGPTPVEILPQVFLGSGDQSRAPSPSDYRVRFRMTAPRHMSILREKLYKKDKV